MRVWVQLSVLKLYAFLHDFMLLHYLLVAFH